jgi:hypothetical protein
MKTLAAIIVLSLSISSAVEAQKNCRKGIPCGNSCISASKVCRIGSSEPAGRAPEYVIPSTVQPLVPSEPEQWVAQARGRVFYRASCQAAKELSELIYFKSQGEALERGYQRSKVPGC